MTAKMCTVVFCHYLMNLFMVHQKKKQTCLYGEKPVKGITPCFARSLLSFMSPDHRIFCKYSHRGLTEGLYLITVFYYFF